MVSHCRRMSALIFRCPNTGHNVQGWVADDPEADDGESYESIACHACGRAHLVNPATGKVLGGGNE